MLRTLRSPNLRIYLTNFYVEHAAVSLFSDIIIFVFVIQMRCVFCKRKLRVFENMVLRRIFGPRRDEVTGE